MTRTGNTGSGAAGRFARRIGLAGVIALALGALASGPALAGGPHGHGKGGWHKGHHPHHHYHGPRHHRPHVVYVPPPRVYYAPPPRVYYAAPPVYYEPPSISFVIPLHIR
ncbi:MAG TPA: hypothetical protein VF274_10505 [Alphaproteobacteria bacterium]|jgi:hypothetical protein